MEGVSKQITLEDCTKILSNSLKRDDFKQIEFQIFSLSNSVEGFLGEHFILKIRYVDNDGPKTERYFLKVLNGTLKVIFELSLSLHSYEKEEFFYNFLLREYEKANINTSFAPKGYLCKPYIIVLEDLSLRGFKTVPKNNFLDLEHSKLALKTLAKFHSSSVLYEAHKTEELGKSYKLAEEYPEMFTEMVFTQKTENVGKEWLMYSVQGILEIVKFIPENHITKKEFADKITDFVKDFHNIPETFTKYKSTALHGDLWSNNFLFKYQETALIDCVLLDYQLLKSGPPSIDVLHFLFANTRKQFRDQHFNALIEFYYDCFSNDLTNLDINEILPKHEYLELCENYQALLKLQCICDRCTTFMPDELVQETVENDEDLRRFLFEDRAKTISACFNNVAFFKELLEEDMLELREILFSQP